jgi:CspA family cold shock protein
MPQPLHPKADGWHCPATDTTSTSRWEYGTLAGLQIPPELDRPDGVVRWYLDDLGWGVIADREGDLFVLFMAIEGQGYRSLREGQVVEYVVAQGQQGRFRRAEHVKPVHDR